MKVGIIAGGPEDLLPDLSAYVNDIDVWIGADRGAVVLLEKGLPIDYAIGDFDSIADPQRKSLETKAKVFRKYPSEKNETDLELAIIQAIELQPQSVYLFGATGGRLDHTLVNLQILLRFAEHDMDAAVVDRLNIVRLAQHGTHTIQNDRQYPYISFIPMTPTVTGLTLNNFYYPLTDQTITFGSTLCVSNKLTANCGTFSIDKGIVLIIKSRDA